MYIHVYIAIHVYAYSGVGQIGGAKYKQVIIKLNTVQNW